MRIKRIGSHQAVWIYDTGDNPHREIIFANGTSADVPDEVAQGLLTREPDKWQLAEVRNG